MLQFPVEDIAQLAARFSYAKPDADCLTAGAGARERGHYNRDEFLLVCAWKTERSRSRVATNSETAVELATGRAFRSQDEAKRMEALTGLEGVGVPTASAFSFRVSDRVSDPGREGAREPRPQGADGLPDRLLGRVPARLPTDRGRIRRGDQDSGQSPLAGVEGEQCEHRRLTA